MASSGITTGYVTTPVDLGNFSFKDNYVLVEKTGAPHISAHPDSCLLLAGFARMGGADINEMQFIGTTSSLAVMESQAVNPLKELGSSRYIFTTNNNPVTIQANSLLINGANLLKALYAGARSLGLTGLDVNAQFSDMNPAGGKYGGYCNLDYPIFSVPFGMAIVSRAVTGEDILSVYAECCLVQNWAWRLQAGQAAVFTDVSIICDRVLPFRFGKDSDYDLVKAKFNQLTFGKIVPTQDNADGV